jgi:hypothetical protein
MCLIYVTQWDLVSKTYSCCVWPSRKKRDFSQKIFKKLFCNKYTQKATRIVRNHTVCRAKNKRMFCSSIFFNLHRKIIFFLYWTHRLCYTQYMIYNKKGPLTWNCGFSYIVTNPYPCWSLAQSKLPHFESPPWPQHPSPFPPLPANTSNTYIQTSLTCPNLLLSGTGIKVVTI